jgi:hypothetical protein
VRRGVVREPRIPPDVRLIEMATEGIGAFYRLHVGSGVPCGCNLMGPDLGCDVGQALYRLSAKERAAS